MKNALIFLSSSFLSLVVSGLEAVLLRRLYVDHLEIVVLEVGHFQVGREDRRSERDRVAGVQQPVGLQRLEDVAHRSGAALDRVEIELAGGARLAAHRPHQILVHDPLVVDQHSIRHRIVVADDRIDQLMDECIRFELEGLDCELHHCRKEGGARHIPLRLEPGVQTSRNAAGLRHAADTCGMIHHPLAFGAGELAEEEERVARPCCNPVGIAAPGIQEGGLRGPRGLPCQLDQLVLDFERAQSFELAQGEDVGHGWLLVTGFARRRTDRSTFKSSASRSPFPRLSVACCRPRT